MSGSKRTDDGGSWLATLGGAVLIVTVGFAVGLVAGVVSEEPDLVWAHLTGESTPASRPSVAAGPRPADAFVPRAPSIPAEASAPPVRPSRTGFSVQVGAFAESGPADNLVAQLRTDGFEAYVAHEPGGPHRVRVGPVESRERADELAESLRSARSLPTWVLREEGS